ncbi:uncharacterized protein N7484_000871 [Penicillium longicatenatum]|uniref:uncharacterized protein n=1 Tax=Penicillium longicatenatum TaxID=1561947 RepID=UPI0025474A8D|nr:uncharacterized protein N7484_000871 [Penicillium longicatenatum]KAJ5657222.1 hypothetical protein N7484_000871 [Penicillium longicatenatum]
METSQLTGGKPRRVCLSLRYAKYALPIYLNKSLKDRKGALCVMALMFNICALGKGWLQSVSTDGSISEPRTPSWDTGLKATSLALAIIAYIAYLLTMTIHADPIKGFMVTVIGWLASATILFSLVGIAFRKHRLVQSHHALIFTENFFAGVISAGLFILAAVLLSIYIVSLNRSTFSPADRRKIECTSILFRVTSFAILLLGEAAVYSDIEGWSLIDSLYFTDYTLLTIGIGNLAPKTHLGRSLLFPFATMGITSLGLFITSVVSFTDQMREIKLQRHIEESQREFRTADSKRTIDDTSTAEVLQSRFPLVKDPIPKCEEIIEIRNARSTFYRRTRWTDLGLFLAAWFVLWFVSAAVFCHSEKEANWTYFVALYFTYASLTTIGYGDLFPTSNFGKVFFIFWSLLAIPILTNLVTVIGNISHIWLSLCSRWVRRHVFRRHGTSEHDHEYMHRSRKTSGSLTTNNPLNLDLCDSGIDIERRNQAYFKPTEGLPTTHVEFEPSDSFGEGPHRIMAKRAEMRCRLMVLEEIEDLISVMRDDSLEHQEELCCRWARIIPLLESKDDTGSFSELLPLFLPAKSERMRESILKDRKKEISERNVEVLWMVTLLVKKLSLDSRQELLETI